MATPRVDRAARSLRVRKPMEPTARMSRGEQAARGEGAGAALMPREVARGRSRPSRIAARRGKGAASWASWVMTTIVVPAALSSGSSSMIGGAGPASRARRWARRRRRSTGRPTSARAIAVRCFSPPESWGLVRGGARVRRPRAPRGRARAARRSGARSRTGRPRRCRQWTAVEQVELLEDEADAPRAQRGELVVARGCRVEAVDDTAPAHGRSSVPMICRSVVLPEPDGPTIVRSSPPRPPAHPVERADAARVLLHDVRKGHQRHVGPPRR